MKKGLILLLAVFVVGGAAFSIWKVFSRSHQEQGAAPGKEGKALYNCAMHPSFMSSDPHAKCPICGMALSSMDKEAKAGGGGGERARGIRINPTTVQNMGVKTQAVERMSLAKDIRTSGKVAVDESRVFSVNARIMGWVEKLHVDVTGQSIRKDQPLLELYSPELVSTQEEFLQAIRYLRSMGEGAGEDARESARRLVESSRRRLRNWDITEGQIQSLEISGVVRNTLALHAPSQGIVLEKMVVQGQNVMPGMALYRIADLSRIWVVADVYQSDLALVKVGARADIELSYLPGRTFQGKVTFVSPMLDMGSRTAQVRIEVPNTPSLELKPEMVATVTLRSSVRIEGVAVPEQSIIRSGRRNVAVVALGGGYFEPREVKLGQSAEGYVQVLDGLGEGENLVVSSQFLIDSESNLKAAIQQMQSRPAMDSAAFDSTGSGRDGEAAPSGIGPVYTCPMHPQILTDRPGKCPLCGMDLVRKR